MILETRVLTDAVIADLAVNALCAEADLTPKPGLVDQRGGGAHTDMDVAMLHASAHALRHSFAACAAAARDCAVDQGLRESLGVIGRTGETRMLAATGGVNTHRGALWALGLLSAGAATAVGIDDIAAVAAQLACLPDRAVIPTASHGEVARRRYGVDGAAGEARAGFPHVRDCALPALRAARAMGADENTARLEALLALIAHVDDTCILHRGGPSGLRAVRDHARAALAAGAFRTADGRRKFTALDHLCQTRRLSPGGSADLLAAALFLDALDERTSPCRP